MTWQYLRKKQVRLSTLNKYSMEYLQLHHDIVTSNYILEKHSFGKWFDVINIFIQQRKSCCSCQFGTKKHHVHVRKQRIRTLLTICTLPLTHVCIRLACLHDSYRCLANGHQAVKLQYFPNLLRTLDLVMLFHLQLLTNN